MFVTSAMTDPAERVATIRDGLRVIGQGIVREPRLFAIAAAGALVFGALTVVDAWALGWATEHALIPAFRDGTIGAGVLVGIVAIFVGLALLRAAGVVARRMGGGIMAFRLQSQDRRDVVSQYLRLPLAWHQRHPTGQLLSN